MTRHSPRPGVLLAVLLVSSLARGATAATLAGVVVEDVATGSAGRKADVRAGDILLAWQPPALPPNSPERAQGSITSAFDWAWVEIEQGPRGAVVVSGERDGKPVTFSIPVGNWGVRVRPRFDETVLRDYLEGRTAVGAKQFDNGLKRWEAAAQSAAAAGDTRNAHWIHLQIADASTEARRWDDAGRALETARALSDTAPDAAARGLTWDAIGRSLERQNRLGEAEKAYQSALDVREQAPLGSLSVARSLQDLGRLSWNRGDLPNADSYFERARAVREALAPQSLDLALTLNAQGLVATDRSDLEAAKRYLTRALAIDEIVAPSSVEMGRVVNNLGNVASNLGELAAAESYYKRALTVFEALAPDGLDVARSFNNLGLVASDRGEMAMAESYLKRGLAIRERLAPDSIELARSLNRLGVLYRRRGDLATAESYYTRALAIREKLAPDSLDVSDSLNNLGTVVHLRGDLSAAESYYRRALAIKEKRAPDSLTVAVTLNNLGHVATDRGDSATANTYHLRALAFDEQQAPGSLNAATSLQNSGSVAIDRGDLPAAVDYLTRALAVRERLAPGSADQAESHYDLGRAYRLRNEPGLAGEHFRRSIDALEAQLGTLGGTQETLSGFGAQYANFYREYIDLLVGQNQPAAAFHVLERSRARTLLAMLAERDLVFTADIPDDIDRERKRIAWEYDQAQATLGALSPLRDQARIDALLAQIRTFRDRQNEIVTRIRQQSPRLASLQYPQPLDVGAVQATLDPGTVLLSYSIGTNRSFLFALTADASVQVFSLPVGETQLREDVRRFHSLIQRAAIGERDVTEVVERGRQLFNLLLQPASAATAQAQRLLIVPDGPLHALPFAALVRAGAASTARERRDWHYLAEWKPVHVVVSATVYAELRKARSNPLTQPPPKTLVALGDPSYPASVTNPRDQHLDHHAVLRAMLTRGYQLTPLPASRREVAAIVGLFGDDAEAYLGEAATEKRAKEAGASARYLHFAAHGLLDERFPLNSGLAMTIPSEIAEGQDNGVLQAWEIFERVRIQADLVVLSACESGLGKEIGGEGLVGLTRAFEYAGAHSVLASLWNVADETTSALMQRFYGYLKAGSSKDAALRQAQQDLISGAVVIQDPEGRPAAFDASHPFHWAAFQMSGDWR